MEDYKHREPMMSVKELTKRYQKIKIELCEENRYNNYMCENEHIIKTVDKHKGVTPFFKMCPICGGQARSTFYNDTIPDEKAKYEWYIPTLKECLKLRKDHGLLDHVLNGGLMFREIKKLNIYTVTYRHPLVGYKGESLHYTVSAINEEEAKKKAMKYKPFKDKIFMKYYDKKYLDAYISKDKKEGEFFYFEGDPRL